MNHPLLAAAMTLLLTPLALAAAAGPTLDQLAREGQPWLDASTLIIARLTAVQPGPTGLSMPPVYSTQLTFDVMKTLRGSAVAGTTIQAGHSARQQNRPVFPKGKLCLVALDHIRHRWRVDHVVPATDQNVALAKLAVRIPLGWSIHEGRLLSPWAAMNLKVWQATLAEPPADVLRCATTHRPALLAGPGIRLAVEPLPPAKAIKWTNPDGDGLFKITVTNTTDQPRAVPALLTADGAIRWAESLVILCQAKAYPPATCGVVKGQARPTVLQPGQSVSTTINALALDGPAWPRGGSRIELRFCLGELSQAVSFYYKSNHHDRIRRQSQPR